MSTTSFLRARWVLALCALLAPALALADTSATLATAINIPKGPASIEGFGRAYEVSPASGLPSLSYPIEIPPGRAGHAPQLALHYHAGSGAGVLGLGWSLDLPAIERSTRAGIPRADGPEVWQLRHLGDSEELTETAPGVYRQRIVYGLRSSAAPVKQTSIRGSSEAINPANVVLRRAAPGIDRRVGSGVDRPDPPLPRA